MSRSLLIKILAVVLAVPVLGVLAVLIFAVVGPPSNDRKPSGKVPIEFRILASRQEDNDAIQKALARDDRDRVPRGYQWVQLDPKSDIKPGDHAIIRNDPKSGDPYILVRLDPYNVTEKDISRIYATEDARQKAAIAFHFNRRGAEHFGALTREHLPKEDGAFKYQVAIILNRAVISAPSINSEIRDMGIIEGGGQGFTKDEVDRLIALITQLYAFAPDTPVPSIDPNTSARKEFRDAKLGLFVHWGVYSLLGKGEWVMDADKLPLSEYEKLPPRFNPAEFDAETWVKAARSAGAKYLTVTAKHHDGFCMFDSKLTRYDVVDATPYAKDPLRPLADACRKHNIKLFFYYSLLDWHHPDYHPRGQSGKAAGRENRGDWKKYVAYYQGQVRELCTNYGPIGGVWFDGQWDRPDAFWDLNDTYQMIHDLQPGALVGNNHHGKPLPGEDFQTIKRARASADKVEDDPALPREICMPLNHSWGHNIYDKDYKDPERVIQALLNASGRGANLLVNVGPRADGTIAPEALERLSAVGKWLDKYGDSVSGTRRGPLPPQPWGVSTTKLDAAGAPLFVYLHVLKPAAPVKLPDTFRSFDARLYGSTDLLPVTQEKGGIRIDLAEKDRAPIDTIVVLTPKLLPR